MRKLYPWFLAQSDNAEITPGCSRLQWETAGGVGVGQVRPSEPVCAKADGEIEAEQAGFQSEDDGGLDYLAPPSPARQYVMRELNTTD
jgi:hypothetical protein